MKDSQDQLHHMKLEQETFNLIAGPFLASIYSFARNETPDSKDDADKSIW